MSTRFLVGCAKVRHSILALLVTCLATVGCGWQGREGNDRNPTVAYWQQLATRAQEWNERRGDDQNLRTADDNCARITCEVEALSTAGVDPDLVQHGKLLVSVMRQDAAVWKDLEHLEQSNNLENWAAQFSKVPDQLKSFRRALNDYNDRSKALAECLSRKFSTPLPDLRLGKAGSSSHQAAVSSEAPELGVEEIAARVHAELVLMPARAAGAFRMGPEISGVIARRTDLSIPQRIVRYRATRNLLWAEDTRDTYGLAPLFDLQRKLHRDVASTEEPELLEQMGKLQVKFAEFKNRQILLNEVEQSLNDKIDLAEAKQIVQAEAAFGDGAHFGWNAQSTLRAKITKVLKANPELAANLRAGLAAERQPIPEALRQSRERVEELIREARAQVAREKAR